MHVYALQITESRIQKTFYPVKSERRDISDLGVMFSSVLWVRIRDAGQNPIHPLEDAGEEEERQYVVFRGTSLSSRRGDELLIAYPDCK